MFKHCTDLLYIGTLVTVIRHVVTPTVHSLPEWLPAWASVKISGLVGQLVLWLFFNLVHRL